MGQFTVYQNENPNTKKTYPYLVDIQSDLLDELRTTVVIPLCDASRLSDQIITKLCPTVEIGGKKYVVLTQLLAGINRNELGREVTNLAEHRSDFVAAIDFIISGI